MPGFIAIRSVSGPVPHEVYSRMIDAGRHRGEPRAWRDRDVVLVAFDSIRGSGLAIAEDLVVVADARLDDRATLDATLGASSSDAERLARAYRRWGRACLTHVLGDVAMAVWDRRRRELIVVRDPTAGKPALLARNRHRTAAASSMAILCADPSADRTIDEAWVASYLAGWPGFARATGFRGMERLEPGHSARADDGWTQRRWWSWSFERSHDTVAEAAEQVRSLLIDATRCRADGATRIGVSLSGGLDSTSIAASLRHARPDADIVALCVAFEQRRANEQRLQRLMADRIGADLRWVSLTGASPFGEDPGATFARYGAPPVAPNMFFVERVAEAASGVQVVLDGLDGDGAFAGNWFYLADLLARGRWRALSAEVRAASRVHSVGRRALLREYAVLPFVPAWARRRSPIAAPIDGRFLRRHRLRAAAAPWAPWRMFAAHERRSVSPHVLPAVLEAIDEAWAARGIEVAHPMQDRRIQQLCLGLTRERKVSGGVTKVVLRAAMRDMLPADVVERTAKAEMSGAFDDAVETQGFPQVQAGLAAERANPSPWVLSGARFDRWAGSLEGESSTAFRIAMLALWRAWTQRSTAEIEHVETGSEGGSG